MRHRHHAHVQASALPGADTRRKTELHAMYALHPEPEQKMLRAIRAQRGIDAIDIFEATLRHEWHAMTAREKAVWRKASTLTTRLQRKLQGLAKFD
jgi:hypothetical protein